MYYVAVCQKRSILRLGGRIPIPYFGYGTETSPNGVTSRYFPWIYAMHTGDIVCRRRDREASCLPVLSLLSSVVWTRAFPF